MSWNEKIFWLLSNCSFDLKNVESVDNSLVISVVIEPNLFEQCREIYNHLGISSGFFNDITYINLNVMICFENSIEICICADFKEFRLENISDSELSTYSNKIKLK